MSYFLGERVILRRYNKLICFLVLVLCVPLLKAEIIETNDIKKILPYVDRDTLLLFDIDNTIIQLPQTLGRPEWFSYLYQKKLRLGVPSEGALKETVTLYKLINQNSKAIPVDVNLAVIIKKLQDQNVVVLGLTSRDNALSKVTVRQLRLNKFNFNRGKFGRYQISLKAGPEAGIKNGIIFTGGKHKGNCLTEFLALFDWRPKKIIFVDDQLKAVQELEQAASKMNINYLGVRYSYLDDKVKTFNPIIADIQLRHFYKTGQLLSDTVALTLIAYEPLD